MRYLQPCWEISTTIRLRYNGDCLVVSRSKDGMELQMRTLSNMGLLSKFIGMLTDSRSFSPSHVMSISDDCCVI